MIVGTHRNAYCLKTRHQNKTDMKSLKIPNGYQNPYIEEEQTIQWPKEKVQRDKQRSTKHTYKTKDRATRNILSIKKNSSILMISVSETFSLESEWFLTK